MAARKPRSSTVIPFTPPAPALPAVVLGTLVAWDPEQGPMIDFPGNRAGPTAARMLVATDIAALQKAAGERTPTALVFESGDPTRPIIVGLVQEPSSRPEARVDGKRVVLTGQDEIELRCGEASISLKKDGKLVIRGAYVETRAKGTNRIKGGSVQIQLMAMQHHEYEPMWEIVEEHLDEAEFLWGMWERSLVAPNYTLDEVAEGPEERLMAHIDGLVVNGPQVAHKLLIPALEEGEPERVSAATVALLLGPQREAGFEAILEVLRELPEQRAPIVRGLECVELPELRVRLRALLSDVDDAIVAAAAEVLAFHHEPLGETLGLLLASEQPATRAMALRAITNEPDPSKHVRAVQAGLQELTPLVLDAAIDAGVRLGLAPAWTRARERAQDPDGGDSMLLLALRGNTSDHAMLLGALQDRKRRLAALWALGFLGTPEAVDASLAWLEDKTAGPLAGEVFTAVTGVDLEETNMTSPPDEEVEALEHRPEDDLPRPDPMAVLRWWMQHRGEYIDGQRYFAGAAYSSAALVHALRSGPMRRRPTLLLDFTLDRARGGPPRLQLRAPVARQQRELTAL